MSGRKAVERIDGNVTIYNYKKKCKRKEVRGPMKRPTIDEMLEITDSRYSLIVAISKRARAIVNPEKKSDEDVTDEISQIAQDTQKPVMRAISDIYEGKYKIVSKQ